MSLNHIHSLCCLSQVFCELFGEDGSSGERILENAQDNFERAKTDVFKFDCVDLGPINVCLFFKTNTIIFFKNIFFHSVYVLDMIIVVLDLVGCCNVLKLMIHVVLKNFISFAIK